MWSVDVRWWAVITLWLLMCLMPVFSHCCRNVNEYVWNIYETQWPSDLVCMFNFPYFMLTHNFKNKFLLIPKRQHVCLFLWRKTKSHDCQTTNNLIKYGWLPDQKCSAPIKPSATEGARVSSNWTFWNMHAPCCEAPTAYAWFSCGCDSAGSHKTQCTRDSFLSCPAVTLTSFHQIIMRWSRVLRVSCHREEGCLDVWKWLTINRIKQELDQLIMSSGFPAGSLRKPTTGRTTGDDVPVNTALLPLKCTVGFKEFAPRLS